MVAALLASLGLFYRRLLSKKKELAGNDGPAAIQPTRKQTVLVVDDDVETIFPAFRPLEKEGFEVITATNAGQALEILESDQHIDLLVTDLIMPYGNAKHGEALYTGLEVIQTARRTRGDLPVICFSVVRSEEVKEKIGQLGVTEYLSKPASIFELSERVKLALAVAQGPPQKELIQDEIAKRKRELKSVHPHTRIRALWALGELGQHDPALISSLKDAAERDPDYYVRRAANTAIRKIQSKSGR